MFDAQILGPGKCNSIFRLENFFCCVPRPCSVVETMAALVGPAAYTRNMYQSVQNTTHMMLSRRPPGGVQQPFPAAPPLSRDPP